MTSSSEVERMGARDVVVTAVAAALVAALGNTLVVLFQSQVLWRPSGASPEFVFLSPIAYLVIFAVATIPLLILVRFLPPRLARVVVPGALATLSAFALLSLIPRLHPVALMLVAIGLGTQVGRAFGRRFASARAVTRRAAAFSAVAVLVLMVSTAAVRQVRAYGLRSAQGVAAPGSPNVILLILDTVRAQNLSVFGYPRPTTPVLERLAASGVAFENTFSSASWSAPSHASMVTGLWGSQTEADYRSKLRTSAPTLPAALNAHGYMTGAFVGNFVYAGRNTGLSRGFAHFEDFPVNLEQAMWSTTLTQSKSGRSVVRGIATREPRRIVDAVRAFDFRFENYAEAARSTPDIINGFWRWRDGVSDRPYFAMLNFMDAHGPYVPPANFRTRFGDGSRDIDRYDGAIAYLDSLVGGIVDGLRDRGELERTVIVVTADHGELFGEHGIKGHVGSIYPRAMHIPLIISGGPVPRGIRVAPEVSLRDLAATILDIAAVKERTLPGKSLRSAWESGTNIGVSPVVIETTKGINVKAGDLTITGAIKGAVDSSWYYIVYGDGREELFRWRTDTLATQNLVSIPEGRAAANRLRERISTELGADALPDASGAGRTSLRR